MSQQRLGIEDLHRDNEIRELRRANGGLREEMERETKRMSAAVVAHQDELYALQQTHQAEVNEVKLTLTLRSPNPNMTLTYPRLI